MRFCSGRRSVWGQSWSNGAARVAPTHGRRSRKHHRALLYGTPLKELQKKFGFTADSVVAAAKQQLEAVLAH